MPGWYSAEDLEAPDEGEALCHGLCPGFRHTQYGVVVREGEVGQSGSLGFADQTGGAECPVAARGVGVEVDQKEPGSSFFRHLSQVPQVLQPRGNGGLFGGAVVVAGDFGDELQHL